MLNELLALERGLTAAGFKVVPRHANVLSPGRSTTLHVRLDVAGQPVEVRALAPDRAASLWTLRDGKQNSFPYVKLKASLLDVSDDGPRQAVHGKAWKKLAKADRRQLLRKLVLGHSPRDIRPFTDGLRKSLRQHHAALSGRLGTEQAAVLAVIERVLAINDGGEGFVAGLAALLADSIEDADDTLLELSRNALVGPSEKKATGDTPLYLDVARHEAAWDVAHRDHSGPISEALSAAEAASLPVGTCLLTGENARLHAGNLPQPSAPVLGQLYLFSKNSDIPAAARYGRADVEGLPLGTDLAQRLAGALDAITAADHKGKSWRSIPGEKPKASDLLIAFVNGVPEAPTADSVSGTEEAEDEDDGFAEETSHLDAAAIERIGEAKGRGDFLAKTDLVVEAVKAKVGSDFRDAALDLIVLRKVDTGNAKAIVQRVLTVGTLYDRAVAWDEALDNLPGWLALPVVRKDRSVRSRGPGALAPLELPRVTRALFIRGGSERAKREPVGITASDSLALFLDEGDDTRIAQVALRVVLARQGGLLAGAAHALRQDAGTGRFDHAAAFVFPKDRKSGSLTLAALRSATLLGLLLAKMERKREKYMKEAAFRLGQLLAAADLIHAGFCVDRRNGDVPPSLLGNSLLAMAQTRPIQCLGLLARRWPVYSAWAKDPKVLRKADATKSTDEKGKVKRSAAGQALSDAYWAAINMKGVAQSLHEQMANDLVVNDAFRAELLLGYVAGLQKAERKGDDAAFNDGAGEIVNEGDNR